MKCPDCGELMKYTACNAPACTAYGCEDCDRGCDLPFKHEVLSRCANAIATVATEAWQPVSAGVLAGPMAEMIATGSLEDRMTVVRTGERDRITSTVRRGVYLRDRGQCQLCGGRPDGGELDHVVPWSAGGSDRSDNLRVACVACNHRRSNYHHLADVERMVPVATSCQVCSRQDYWQGAGRLLEVFCMECRRHSSSYAVNTI